MMHIVYLIPSVDRIAGAERQLILLASGMARRGWRVTVIALSGKGGHAADELTANDVSFISLEMRHGLADPRGWNRLRRWVTSAQPEILHAHLPQAALMARGIRLLTPVRVVVDTIHSPAVGSKLRHLGYRVTSRIPDCVTAVSQTTTRTKLGARKNDHAALIVVPNGIDTGFWKPSHDLRNHYQTSSASTGDFHWLAVGRLDPVKDHVSLLSAFALLPQSARLTIAGSGPLDRALQLQASNLCVRDRVQFLGFQKDIRPLMQNADAFVLSSRWEGLPVALMEAIACQLPTAFTETPGSRELLPDSHLPIASVGDPVCLANTMNALMNLPQSERRGLAIRARHQIVARFDLQAVLNRYELIYRNLLAANPRQSRSRMRSDSLQQSHPACPRNPEI